MKTKGKVWKFGDHINTDDIISARYLNTTDEKELASHCFESIRPEFSKNVKNGDIIVAGENFGCGSSREHAPISIKGCGISVVIAKSFARIFFRNSINIGLPLIELKEVDEIKENDILEVDFENGIIINLNSEKTYKFQKYPEFLQKIVLSGGLMELAKKYLKEKNNENY
ncbi:MAG: 3-isopropylmalate dehydratase small subunit [bacterium]|nr:3-isopropylmalate dehydratase small subunit [bacterium]MCX7917925.1 3-isopropylmalate dehydratase small subunit [bacterium]MDW8163333.1 3-isopropylmalate dehydratase small subunit [Candidatus Omnitrophota bacterium]